jgi:hypothetical protein
LHIFAKIDPIYRAGTEAAPSFKNYIDNNIPLPEYHLALLLEIIQMNAC